MWAYIISGRSGWIRFAAAGLRFVRPQQPADAFTALLQVNNDSGHKRKRNVDCPLLLLLLLPLLLLSFSPFLLVVLVAVAGSHEAELRSCQ